MFQHLREGGGGGFSMTRQHNQSSIETGLHRKETHPHAALKVFLGELKIKKILKNGNSFPPVAISRTNVVSYFTSRHPLSYLSRVAF